MYLGLNAYSHDSSACLIDEAGRVVAAVEEERFNRIKHFSGFPEQSIKFCLKKAGISTKEIAGVAVGWSTKKLFFDRIIKEYLIQFHPPMHVFMKSLIKLGFLSTIEHRIERSVGRLSSDVKAKFYEHHKAHAASAFYASKFDDAAFLTIDARGEYDSSLWGTIDFESGMLVKGRISHPSSMGCVWGAIGEYCGFTPGWQKAGTTMAFAALGKPLYLDKLKSIIGFHPNADNNWLVVNTGYFEIADCKGEPSFLFDELIGAPRARPGMHLQVHSDIAASWQEYHQEIVLGKLNSIYEKTKKTKLVMAGGVCLNCVTNGMIIENTPFEDCFIQPASNDAGVAVGAAYILHQESNKRMRPEEFTDVFLGPEYSSVEILAVLEKYTDTLEFSRVKGIQKTVAKLLFGGEIVAWFQGRLEFGPRALGARSILSAAADKTITGRLNRIKKRESFRPFAISILEYKSRDWLIRGTESPYMLFVDHLRTERKNVVPAAQHIDGTVRVQTVNKSTNPIFHSLLLEYYNLSQIPLLINTSYNTKGFPIVNDPEQAIQAFFELSDIRYLAIGDYLVKKKAP